MHILLGRKQSWLRLNAFLHLLLLLSVNWPCISHGQPDNQSNHGSLKDLLPQSCFIAGQFKQEKHIVDVPTALTSAGSFIYSCRQGLIWVTDTPIVETLIYRRDSAHASISPSNEVQRLKGRLHKELGSILNNLIGANIDYVEQHFDVTVKDQQQILTPKNKRLRKFISTISLSSSDDGILLHIDGETESTLITIRQTQIFEMIDAGNCSSLFVAHTQACNVLFN